MNSRQSRSDASVSEIACYRVDITPLGGSFRMSGGRRYDVFPSTVVKVTGDDGTYGLGEASTLAGDYLEGFRASSEAAIALLAPHVLPIDVFSPHVLNRAMDRALIGHYPGKAALDIALWDLRAKLLNLPVSQLMGGSAQSSLPAWTGVQIGTTEATVREATLFVDSGYTRLQIKVGDNPREDADRVRDILAAVGNRLDYVACDANQRWSTAEALIFVNRLAEPEVFLEQLTPALSDTVHLARRVPNPIVMDEGARTARDLLDAVSARCVNAVNIKPVRVGGLTKAVLLRDVAQTAGLRVLVDEPMGGLVASAGIASLAASVDPTTLVAAAWFGDHNYNTDSGPVPGKGPTFDRGRVAHFSTPGLGADLDLSALGAPVFRYSRQ